MSLDQKELKKLLDGRELKSTEDLQDLLRDLTKEVDDTIYDNKTVDATVRNFEIIG